MNPLDDLTVCVTSFRRGQFLARALESLRAAGIRRVAIAAVEPTEEVETVIRANQDGWLSFDVARVAMDIGCNSSWMLAAYKSRTSRIILLHDDDTLEPPFAEAYTNVIAPILDNAGYGVGIVSWRAHVRNEDGSIRPTEYFRGSTRILEARQLAGLVSQFNHLSLSPVVSILNRAVLIRACKEAEATLIHNECLLRPGMLLGTEIVVYLRHCKASLNWLYVDQILSMYGSHAGSGTVEAERAGDLRPLTAGYDRARAQAAMNRPPEPMPKIILAHQPVNKANPREAVAQASWDHQFQTFDMIDCEVMPARTSADVDDDNPTFFVRDIFDAACEMALAEDIIAYVNTDIGLTTHAPERILAGVTRGRGATTCPRRNMPGVTPGRLYKTVKNCKTDGGMDCFAMTAAWWKAFRDKMPDMLLGREAWDLCLRTLIEEWADGGAPHSYMTIIPGDWWKSKAYTDDVIWHEPHPSFWITNRLKNPGGKYNRALAREFFEARRNFTGLACVGEPSEAPPSPAVVSITKELITTAAAARAGNKGDNGAN
jgi:hypothetical protein